MRKSGMNLRKYIAAGIFCVCFALTGAGALPVQAEEMSGYYDETGNWVEGISAGVLLLEEEAGAEPYIDSPQEESSGESAEALTGSYSVPDGWTEDTSAGTADKKVYKQSANVGVADTSTISCSYLDTNYSVLEYELLRDMLSNNLIYSNVNAQISTSAVYTLAKDYLYILIVDDSQQEYRNIYYYVVGDYRCFSVEVCEYRTEAEQARSQDQKTPQEVGQKVAEEFTWNTF